MNKIIDSCEKFMLLKESFNRIDYSTNLFSTKELLYIWHTYFTPQKYGNEFSKFSMIKFNFLNSINRGDASKDGRDIEIKFSILPYCSYKGHGWKQVRLFQDVDFLLSFGILDEGKIRNFFIPKSELIELNNKYKFSNTHSGGECKTIAINEKNINNISKYEIESL